MRQPQDSNERDSAARSAASNAAADTGARTPVAQTVDNRTESAWLGNLQAMANSGPEAARVAQLVAMANRRRRRTPLKVVAQLFRNEQYEAIYNQLNAFCNAWTANGIAADIPGAYADLVARLGAVGIRLGDNAGSMAANPLVRGLWIGEIIDTIHTLSLFLDDATGFLAQKFWDKLETMREIMGEDD